MEKQEQRNGTNVIGDLKDGFDMIGDSMGGNPLKYTWNFFGMAFIALGSIVLLKGNQMVRDYNANHYSEDQISDKNSEADRGLNAKLGALTEFVSSKSFTPEPKGLVNSSDHGQMVKK